MSVTGASPPLVTLINPIAWRSNQNPTG